MNPEILAIESIKMLKDQNKKYRLLLEAILHSHGGAILVYDRDIERSTGKTPIRVESGTKPDEFFRIVRLDNV